jgi:hypothetical protein
VIFAEGHGGDCTYTYAWNVESDVRAEGIRGPALFEVTTDRPANAIVGTVVVTSGDETVRVPLYIRAP